MWGQGEEDGRVVAVKVVQYCEEGEGGDRAGPHNRHLLEAIVGMQLNHPNLVRTHRFAVPSLEVSLECQHWLWW